MPFVKMRFFEVPPKKNTTKIRKLFTPQPANYEIRIGKSQVGEFIFWFYMVNMTAGRTMIPGNFGVGTKIKLFFSQKLL